MEELVEQLLLDWLQPHSQPKELALMIID